MIRIEAPERHLFTRREFIAKTATGILIASGASAPRAAVDTVSLQISDRLSPRNRKRPHRPYTRYIVLHTTEGEEAGSLQKVVRYGETHYFVGTSGRVYRVIEIGYLFIYPVHSQGILNKVICAYTKEIYLLC